MPIENGIGYGEFTDLKIRHLAKIFEMHLSITKAVLNRNPNFLQTYHYIDATAGKGSTPDGTTGSPIVFLEKIEQFQMNYRADFIECNECNINELEKEVRSKSLINKWRVPNLHFYHDRYEIVITDLLPTVNGKELGLVVCKTCFDG